MKSIQDWLRAHKFAVHSIAFLLILIPPIPMYLAANAGSSEWIIALLVPVIVGNLLVLGVK